MQSSPESVCNSYGGPRQQPREEGGDTTGVGDDPPPPRYHIEKRHGPSFCVVRSSCSPGDAGPFCQCSLVRRHLGRGVDPALGRLRAQGYGSPTGASSGRLVKISKQVAEEVSS